MAQHCNGIFVNNYLLNGNEVQLYFTEMNSRFFIFRAKRETNSSRVHRGEIKLHFSRLICHFCFSKDISIINRNIREFTQRQEYDYDYVNGCLKGLGLIVIVSLNVGLR